MQAQRAKLPMCGLKQQLADTLAGSDAVVVSGETGSGKTTQVGAFVLFWEFGGVLLGACLVLQRSYQVGLPGG